MGKTNSLTSHHGESNVHRVDKMSGLDKLAKDAFKGESKKYLKKFSTKKRRGILNNPQFFEKF